jgi:hypothetical protein
MPARLAFSVDSPGCVASRDIFNDGRSHFGLMVLAAVRTPKAQRTGPDASQALAVSPKLKINGFPRFGATTTEILHGRLHLKGRPRISVFCSWIWYDSVRPSTISAGPVEIARGVQRSDLWSFHRRRRRGNVLTPASLPAPTAWTGLWASSPRRCFCVARPSG